MKKSRTSLVASGAVIFLAAGLQSFGASALTEKLLNTDGSVNDAGFNTTTGLGTITVTVTGAGLKKSYLYFDHELSSDINTFFNENGGTKPGAVPAGLSFEVDEPGWASAPDGPGDIYSNFAALTLDNGVFKVGAATLPQPNDVSMAFGWDFSLLAGETAYISYIVADSLQSIGSRYYLTQSDPDSNETLYFATSLDIRGGGNQPIPEGSTVVGASALAALIGYAGWRRRRALQAV